MMVIKMRIMIDLDDTIAPSSFLAYINEFEGANYTYDDVKSYYIETLLPEEKRGEYFNYVFAKGMYKDVLPYENACEVIEELCKIHEVYIVSAFILKEFPDKSGKCLDQKFDWIRKYLPYIKPKNIIFASDKSIIDIDVRIDDKVSNMAGSGTIKLLYNAYHNIDNAPEEELKEKGIIRVDNWLEIKEILLNKK